MSACSDANTGKSLTCRPRECLSRTVPGSFFQPLTNAYTAPAIVRLQCTRFNHAPALTRLGFIPCFTGFRDCTGSTLLLSPSAPLIPVFSLPSLSRPSLPADVFFFALFPTPPVCLHPSFLLLFLSSIFSLFYQSDATTRLAFYAELQRKSISLPMKSTTFVFLHPPDSFIFPPCLLHAAKDILLCPCTFLYIYI